MAPTTDRESLEALYRARFQSFLRIAATITGDPSSAHDAVQDGFARALRSLDTFRGEAPLEAWVWRIVLNAACDVRPAGAIEPVAHRGESTHPPTDEDGLDSELAVWIAGLPERQRQMIFLRYEADLDYRSIALVLGVKVGTVSATLYAAHERLRSSLQEVRR